MKIDRRVLIAGAIVIGGIFLLWLIRKSTVAVSANGNYPDAGQAPGQPSLGDVELPSLPDVGQLPEPRFSVGTGGSKSGCGCDDEESCGGGVSNYVDTSAPALIAPEYMEAATATYNHYISRSVGG
jgi:hypothetical protein